MTTYTRNQNKEYFSFQEMKEFLRTVKKKNSVQVCFRKCDESDGTQRMFEIS